ncbi:uncharacterized protein FA14DRAFT_12844 [Meira miltonrushii]|uniref:Uncharacterized protein n=1 Tax=Meira miltonrushii TaxID=1280837 RepID=A0A316VI65_9BASI|nr:uncharacterized protein FA14DRAFT_12844 [Meira miltonrushii]PWN37292.1 hypothetical protein FA14DRAFT_12844 [Meira miltonrushii]
MLSGTTPNLIVRPKPPGSRRSSTKQDSPSALQARKFSADQQDAASATLLPSPSLTNSDTFSISSDAKHAMGFERDLDLDLPSDLTEALEKSMQRRPKRSNTSSNKENVNPFDHLQEGAAAQMKESSNQYAENQADIESSADRLAHSFEGKAELQHRSTISIDSQNIGSDASIDENWIGDLSREELETLLFESRQIIKERERDLGIAAAIGKALLDKNISLRSRHEGIVSRFSSMNSMERIIADQSNDVNTPLPRYSPPHSDSANNRNEIDQRTPRPGEMPQSGSGYFQGMTASPSAKRMANVQRSESIIEELDERQLWNSSGNYFVPSRPASPHAATFGDTSLSSISASETHRRLELISQQNDDLLEQISQLHVESEDAKREGGKRQKRLIREIDGLRAELEAAEARTMELERNAEMQKKALEAGQEQVKKQPWRRRGKMPWQSPGSKRKNSQNDGRDQTETNEKDVRAESSSMLGEDGKDADALSLTGQSESSMSISGKSRLQTDGERAIVSQLMAKVRELEEINISLIKDAHERDGRIGRFLEDSERIRDLYDAVESEAVSNLSAEPSIQDLTVMGQDSTPMSSAAASPIARRRRAPGNRHLIENRRTVRAAMQNDHENRSPVVQLDDFFDDSLNNSSVDSSPVKARPSRKMLRPRILITPSCEDLHARSENDRAFGWEDVDQEGSSHYGQMTKSSSDPTLYEDQVEEKTRKGLIHRASDSNLGSISSRSNHNLHRSLGSELGSVYGDRDVEYDDDDAPQQDGEESSPSRRSLYSSDRRKGKAPRKAASQASLRSMSEAGSDIADLKWSNGSTWTLRTEYDLPEIDDKPYKAIAAAPSQELAIIPTHQSLSRIAARPDGEWYSNVAQSLLPRGALRNDVETSHDNYSLLEKLTKSVPVHWADDEDFGKPITEREAINLGLLEDKRDRNRIGSGSRTARGMLSWIKPLRTKTRKAEDETETTSKISSKRQIETAEDVERRRALERLLRAKRIAALHDRILAGQMSEEEARAKGAFDSLDDENQSVLANLSFEAEVTQRALAYRTVRRRQMSNGIYSGEQDQLSRIPRSGSSRSSIHDIRQLSRERRGVQGEGEKNSSGEIRTEGEESFEFVDLDPSKRRPGRRGTDYYPITLRERYKPEMVKQRMQNFSNETMTWAMAWATFSIVMVFAFVAAFARGPKRILHGQQIQHNQP